MQFSCVVVEDNIEPDNNHGNEANYPKYNGATVNCPFPVIILHFHFILIRESKTGTLKNPRSFFLQ
jgi:hypothetical protein